MNNTKGLPAKRRRWQAGNTTLIVMLVVAGAALLLGFLVIRQRIKIPPAAQTNSDSSSNPIPEQTIPAQNPDEPAQTPATLVVPATWKVYNNDKYNFSLQYPPGLKVGTVSGNSVLGTAQVSVKGFHVGPLVLVVLRDAETKKLASDYFNEGYNIALNPVATPGGEGQGVKCSIDKIANSAVKSVSCNGEGGPAKSAYITGSTYDVFVDGYSNGFDSQDFGKLAADSDYAMMLGTFKFSVTSAQAAPAPAPAPTPNSAPASAPILAPTPKPTPPPPQTPTTSTPVIKTFSISADDSGATPSEITVAKGTTVEITFKVASANVYYGGLDFRSSVVNSGTINSGGSKTISFAANKSFSFTPYWPASGVAKPYAIKVTVN